MDPKKKAVLDRIGEFEEAIAKGRAYLETGEYADWQGFRPIFDTKKQDGKVMPPHKDWVRNVFLRNKERALHLNEKLLARLEESARTCKTGTQRER